MAGEKIMCITSRKPWATSVTELHAGLDAGVEPEDVWQQELVRASLGGRVSARRLLAGDPQCFLWPHVHILPQDSSLEGNVSIQEDFTKGAGPDCCI